MYDVCDPKIRTDDLIVEKMAVRPNDEKFAKRLSEEDSYAEVFRIIIKKRRN